MFKFMPKSNRSGFYSDELENCMLKDLDKYSNEIKLMNAVTTESHEFDQFNNEISLSQSKSNIQEKSIYLPYTGNGYIGVSIQSKQGLYANYHKSLSLNLNFNPLVQVYSDRLSKMETSVVEFRNGMVHLLQCYQNNDDDCFSIENTLYAHRTRPSLLIEEVQFNNPTKDTVTFNILQMGENNWNHSKSIIENINGEDFSITSGIIDVVIDQKLKHLCVSIGTTRLPVTKLLKEHQFFVTHNVMTVVKYSSAFLSGKLDNLDPILKDLESNVIQELKESLDIGFIKLKNEHINAWNTIWDSGFEISKSLATGAINGDQFNASIYYALTNTRAPLLEVQKLSSNTAIESVENVPRFNMERCYDGFSTLHALKLWKLPINEREISDSTLLWLLTLQKHGCTSLLDLGVTGFLQAIVLSIGGLKFTHHHLDLNLNPRQLHRDYEFRNINYANMSLISVEVVVGSDNHAKLYVTLNELIDSKKKFYACDAGCIDAPVELQINYRQEFPVKLTNPITAILYISSDEDHINDLKNFMHVQEIDIAPAQDVNSIATHKHGHHMAGFTALFWIIFVILIIIFHLFLIKLVYRELCGNNDPRGSYDYKKKLHYARTV